MDPFTVCLIFSAIIVKLIKVDAQRAQRGETPPGYRLVEKWLDRRKARGQAPADAKPARYGMWRYFWQRWRALWEVLGEEHKARHEQYLQQRVEAARSGTPKPPRPSLKEQAAGAWQWVLDNVIGPVGENEPPAKRAPAPEATAGQPPAPVDPGKPQPEGEPRIACDDCGAVLVDAEGGYVHPGDNKCGKAWPAADPRPPSAPAESAEPPRTEPVQPNEGDDMTAPTQASGEVTGIPSAVNYLGRVAKVHTAHAEEGETLVARMADMKIGSGDIGLVQAAVAASTDASSLYERAAKELDRTNAGVRDAYASGGTEAADKRAQMAE